MLLSFSTKNPDFNHAQFTYRVSRDWTWPIIGQNMSFVSRNECETASLTKCDDVWTLIDMNIAKWNVYTNRLDVIITMIDTETKIIQGTHRNLRNVIWTSYAWEQKQGTHFNYKLQRETSPDGKTLSYPFRLVILANGKMEVKLRCVSDKFALSKERHKTTS